MLDQFEDPVEEGRSVLDVRGNATQSDDDFVKAMRDKMTMHPDERRPGRADDPAGEDSADLVEAADEYYDDDDDDPYYDDLVDDDDLVAAKGCLSNSSLSAQRLGGLDSSRLNLHSSHKVSNAVERMHRLESTKRTLHTGRDDRATSEQVLDPRTRMILFRMLSSGFLELIDGCLSTGKEANVYYARAGRDAAWLGRAGAAGPEGAATFAPLLSPEISEYAVKIYKTSTLVFRDRDRYVSGEHRWRRGYCRSNPRKMVKVWAEKEMRNYRRIHAAGIRCPAPVLLKGHVLVMEFLGAGGWPSPRIRDAGLSERRLREAYVQTMLIMRHMYRRCRLVHGDLSEYNLLWHNNEVYVIDVSQSVESDHPSALDFLRKDASNVNDFFRRAGNLNVMTTRQLFEFVTSSVIEDDPEAESAAMDAVMARVDGDAARMEAATEDERRAASQEEAAEEAVFMSQFLPRSLSQVADSDVGRIEGGDVEETYARAVAALTGNADVVDAVSRRRGAGTNPESARATFASDDDEAPALVELAEMDSEDFVVEESEDELNSHRSDDSGPIRDSGRRARVAMTPDEVAAAREAARAERKASKKAAKEAQSERRKTKIKKKDKKRAINKTRGNKKKK